jgi:hypothetical protein
MTLPSGPEIGVKFTLTGPDGTVATFNEESDFNYVGAITEATGLDSPEVRENAENIAGFDGGVHGNFYYGRRPVVLTGKIFNVSSNEERNKKLTKLLQASNAMREDAVLEWTPTGGEAQYLKVRRAQPLRVSGAFDKDFQLSLVSADPRIYSVSTSKSKTASGEYLNTALISISTGSPLGCAVDATYIYWANPEANTIGRAKLNGSAPEVNFITGCHSPQGVAVDAGHIYWCNSSTNCIGRATIAGATVEQEFVKTAPLGPRGIAVDASHIYWANYTSNTIGRATTAGATVEGSWITTAEKPIGVAVDSGHVYWALYASQNIARATIAGGSVENTWIKEPGTNPSYPAVNASYIYWTNHVPSTAATIGRATILGQNSDPTWQVAPNGGFGMAINTTKIFVTGYNGKEIASGPLKPPEYNNQGSNTTYPKFIITGSAINPRIRNSKTKQELSMHYSPAAPEPNWSWQVPGSKGSLAADSTYLYWINQGTLKHIGRMRLDGTENNSTWASMGLAFGKVPVPSMIAVNESNIYWVESGSKKWTIARSTITGGEIEHSWASLGEVTTSVQAMAIDATYIYIANSNGIGRVKLSNAAQELSWIAATTAEGIAVDAAHIYWTPTAGKEIKRATIAGAEKAKFFSTEPLYGCGVAVDASHIYWIARDEKFSSIGLGRAAIGGTSIEPEWKTGGPGVAELETLVRTSEALFWPTTSVFGRLKTSGEQTIEIDTLHRTIKLAATGEQLYRTLEFPQSEWFGLAPGENPLTLIATGEEAALEVQWQSAWI